MTSDTHPRELQQRFLASYAIALFLLIAVSLGAHLYINASLADEREAARMVNLSGAQRMLSQRTLALAQSLSDEATRSEDNLERLAITLNRFEAAHRELRTYALSHPMGDELSEAFQARFETLNGRVASFVALAEPASQRLLTPEELSQIEALAYGALFEDLDAAVSLFQADAEDGLATIGAAHIIQLVIIILVLAGEALFIFWPLTRRLVTAMATEIKARQQAEDALRLEASMDASKQRFISMVRSDFLNPLEKTTEALSDMEASDRASWPGHLARIRNELDRTRQRVTDMANAFDQWRQRYGTKGEGQDDGRDRDDPMPERAGKT
jgi:hypothetical protein